MPVRQLHRRVEDQEAQDLLHRLVEEWKNPKPEAFEQRYGLDETLKLRSAMGLTQIEASRPGIK